MAGPDWLSGHLAIVVTADEDDRTQSNLVLTVVAHPSLHGAVVTTPLTHYSLARLYSEVLAAQPLGEAAAAPSMATAFGLDLSGR
jgi:acid phosphatase